MMDRGMKRGFAITAVSLVVMTLALLFLNGWWLVGAFTLGAAACIAFPPKPQGLDTNTNNKEKETNERSR